MSTSTRIAPLYLLGAALSLFGNAAITIVLPWLVLSRTGDPSAAGLVAAAAGIASVPATFFSGRLIDRLGPRTVALVADIGSATSVAGLAIVDATVGLNLAWFVMLGVAGAIFDVPGMTARQTMLADVSTGSGVGIDRLAGFFQVTFGLAFLAGPGVAGGLLSIMEPIDVGWLTTACSALAAISTALLRVGSPTGATDADDAPRLGGWATIRSSRALVAMLVLTLTSSFVSPPLVSVLLPGHFSSIGAPEQLGLAMSSFAVGTLLGSGLYPLLARLSRRIAYVVGVLGITAGLWLVAPLDGFWLVAAGTAVLGIGSGLFGPVWNVHVAERVPAHARGQVLAITNAASLAAGPLGLGLLALILTRWELTVGALAIAAVWSVAAAYGLFGRGARGLTQPPPAGPAGAPADDVPATRPAEHAGTAG